MSPDHQQGCAQRLEQQRALLTSLLYGSNTEESADAALTRSRRIYRNNLLATAARALSLTYPVLKKMLGGETLTILSQRLLLQETPDTGDWGDWGSSLGWLLTSSELHQEHPYLAEMASFEWQLHSALRAPLSHFDSASLSLLSNTALEHIRITPVPSLSVFASPFPVARLRALHRPQDEDYLPSEPQLASVFQRWQEDEYSLIWQAQRQLQIQQLSAAEYHWFRQLLCGSSVSGLIDQQPQIDFSPWLTDAIQQGWITGLTLI